MITASNHAAPVSTRHTEMDVSVVLCTYNRQNDLRLALESLMVLAAPEFNYEIVVVDDGSVDQTPTVVEELANASPVEIHYIRQENSGVAAARNTGVRHARGAWVAFFDDDQLADPNWLAGLLSTAKSTGADCVGGACLLQISGRPDVELPRVVRKMLGERLTSEQYTSDRRFFDPRRRHILPNTGNALIHRGVFDRIGFFSEHLRFCEDTEFFRRAQKSGARFASASDSIVLHVVQPDRLNPDYMLHRTGINAAAIAQIDFQTLGTVYALWTASLRLLHLVAWTIPGMLAFALLHNRSGVLGKRCSARFATAYLSSMATLTLQTVEIRASSGLLLSKTIQILRSKALLALLDQGVVSLGNFLTGLAIGRIAGKAELGLYAVSWTLVTLTSEISAALVTTPYTVFGPQMHALARSRYLGSMFVQQIVIYLLLSAFTFLGIAIAGSHGPSSAPLHSTTVTASVLLFLGLREFVRRTTMADLRVALTVAFDVSMSFLQVVGVVMLYLTHQLSSSSVFILLGALSAATVLAWLYVYRKNLAFDRKYWTAGFWYNWNFAKWVLLGGISWASAMHLYPWFLTFLQSASVTGGWAACWSIVAFGNPVVVGLCNYVGPRVSNAYATEGLQPMRREVFRLSLMLSAVVAPFTLLLLAFGEQTLTHVYGPAYSGNGIVVGLLGVYVLVGAFNFSYSRGLFVVQAARTDTFINFAAIFLLCTIGIASIKAYGALGAASSLLLSSVATTVLRLLAFRSRTSGNHHQPRAILATFGNTHPSFSE